MAIYRKISPRMYADAAFRRLSAPQPNGQTLWTYLLTGPHTTSIPGVIPVGEMALAETLGWPIKGLRSALRELMDAGMIRVDLAARLIFIPKAVKHNAPESPNVVLSWHSQWELVPECELKEDARASLYEALCELGAAYAAAWESTSVRHPNYKVRPETMAAAKSRDEGRCRYCGIIVSWSDRRGKSAGTYDHIDPKGPGSLDNIVVACNACNGRKGFRTPSQAGMTLIQIGSRSDLDQITESGTGTGTGTGTGGREPPSAKPSIEQPRPPKKPTVAGRLAQKFWFIQRGGKEDEFKLGDMIEEMLRVGYKAEAIEAEIDREDRDRSERSFKLKDRLEKARSPTKTAPKPLSGSLAFLQGATQ